MIYVRIRTVKRFGLEVAIVTVNDTLATEFLSVNGAISWVKSRFPNAKISH